MNLETQISPILWSAIRQPYQAGQYSHAILEAFHYLSNLLRDKAGVDGDGASLVGQALGGEAPRLKINALQTDTERNVQKGLEHLLRGLYIAFRNPRSHEQVSDSQSTADAIIHFVSFVASILDRSRSGFTIEAFLERVFDSEFVDSRRYAELIVSEVPSIRLGDAVIAMFAGRTRGDLTKRRILVETVVSQMSEAQLTNYLSVVSEELRIIADDGGIRTALQMLTPETWPRLGEVARLRIENRLIQGIRQGEFSATAKSLTLSQRGPVGS